MEQTYSRLRPIVARLTAIYARRPLHHRDGHDSAHVNVAHYAHARVRIASGCRAGTVRCVVASVFVQGSNDVHRLSETTRAWRVQSWYGNTASSVLHTSCVAASSFMAHEARSSSVSGW